MNAGFFIQLFPFGAIFGSNGLRRHFTLLDFLGLVHLFEEASRRNKFLNLGNNVGCKTTLIRILGTVKALLALEGKLAKSLISDMTIHKGTAAAEHIVTVHAKGILNDGFGRRWDNGLQTNNNNNDEEIKELETK